MNIVSDNPGKESVMFTFVNNTCISKTYQVYIEIVILNNSQRSLVFFNLSLYQLGTNNTCFQQCSLPVLTEDHQIKIEMSLQKAATVCTWKAQIQQKFFKIHITLVVFEGPQTLSTGLGCMYGGIWIIQQAHQTGKMQNVWISCSSVKQYVPQFAFLNETVITVHDAYKKLSSIWFNISCNHSQK